MVAYHAPRVFPHRHQKTALEDAPIPKTKCDEVDEVFVKVDFCVIINSD